MKKTILTTLVAVALTGCNSLATTHYYEDYAASLKPRSTLDVEAISVLGEPTERIYQDDGTVIYHWNFVDSQPFVKTMYKTVSLQFDTNGQFLRRIPSPPPSTEPPVR